MIYGRPGALPPAGGKMLGGGGVGVVGGVGLGVKVGVASARAVEVALANWALIVARKLT